MLYTTTSKALYFSNKSEYAVNAVIVTVKNPEKIDAVISGINSIAPDLKAWRAKDLKKSTIINVMTANNMGMSFGTLVVFAIISSLGFFVVEVEGEALPFFHVI